MKKEKFFETLKKYYSEKDIEDVMSWFHIEEGDEITEKSAEAFLFHLPDVEVKRGDYGYRDLGDDVGVIDKNGRKGKIECEWSAYEKFFQILEGTDPVQAGWKIKWEG